MTVIFGGAPQRVVVAIELPHELQRLALPTALDRRLHALLDEQDRGEELTADERAEADGLATLSELLDLLRLRVNHVTGP